MTDRNSERWYGKTKQKESMLGELHLYHSATSDWSNGVTFCSFHISHNQPWFVCCWVKIWHWVWVHAQCPIPLLQRSSAWAAMVMHMVHDGRDNLNPLWLPRTRRRCCGGNHTVWLCNSQCHQVLQSSIYKALVQMSTRWVQMIGIRDRNSWYKDKNSWCKDALKIMTEIEVDRHILMYGSFKGCDW